MDWTSVGNGLLGVLVQVLISFLQKLFVTPVFNFIDAAIFGSNS